MHLDGITLMVAGCFVAILTGVLLLAAWAETRRSQPLLWWASASLVNGVAATALSVGLATGNTLAIGAGAGGLAASMAMYHGGVELFVGRLPSYGPLLAAAGIWTASALPF